MTSENLIGKSGFQATFDCQFTFPAVLCTCMVIWPTAPTMLKVFFPEVVYWQRTDEKCPFQGFGHECDFLLGTSVLPFVCNDTMIIIRSRMCVSLRHILNCPLFQCDLWGYGFSVCCCAFFAIHVCVPRLHTTWVNTIQYCTNAYQLFPATFTSPAGALAVNLWFCTGSEGPWVLYRVRTWTRCCVFLVSHSRAAFVYWM